MTRNPTKPTIKQTIGQTIEARRSPMICGFRAPGVPAVPGAFRISRRVRGALLAAALLGAGVSWTACDDDAAPAPTAPTPAEPIPLEWVGVPERVTLGPGESRTLELRLSSAVNVVLRTIVDGDDIVRVESEVSALGRVTIRLEARGSGFATMELQASHPDFQTAVVEIALAVEAATDGTSGQIRTQTFVCRSSDHLGQAVNAVGASIETLVLAIVSPALVVTLDASGLVAWIQDRLDAGECGNFMADDPVERTGETITWTADPGGIEFTFLQVSGRPLSGPRIDVLQPVSLWWVLDYHTTFVPPRSAAAAATVGVPAGPGGGPLSLSTPNAATTSRKGKGTEPER